MTDNHRQPDRHEDFDLPESLIHDLRTAVGPLDAIPGEADDRILAMGRRNLGRHRGLRLVASVATLTAAAAAIALVILLPTTTEGPRSADTPSTLQTQPPRELAKQAFFPEDIDASGRVDILDAFTLARYIDRDSAYRPTWDFNNDGQLDQHDVDAVAHRAVKLNLIGEATP